MRSTSALPLQLLMHKAGKSQGGPASFKELCLASAAFITYKNSLFCTAVMKDSGRNPAVLFIWSPSLLTSLFSVPNRFCLCFFKRVAVLSMQSQQHKGGLKSSCCYAQLHLVIFQPFPKTPLCCLFKSDFLFVPIPLFHINIFFLNKSVLKAKLSCLLNVSHLSPPFQAE